MGLPEFLGAHLWDGPSCFCAMLGSPRKAQFVVPTQQESPAFGMMCLSCPECPYFGTLTISDLYSRTHRSNFNIVNISELVELHKEEIAAVKGEDIRGDGSSALEKAPKKKKHDLRGARPKGKETARTDIIGSSRSHPIKLDAKFELDDRPSAGLSSVVTNLSSIHGALQEQFRTAFGICSICNRVVSNEISRLNNHVCVIDVEDCPSNE